MQIIKTIVLNLLPLTHSKTESLEELEQKWLEGSNHCFETLRYWDVVAPDIPLTRYNLHALEYRHVKKMTGLQSQLVVDLFKNVFAIWHEYHVNAIGNASISFNIPRSGDIVSSRNKNPLMIVRALKRRLGLPIAQDGAWHRFKQFLREGWKFTAFQLKRYGSIWRILVSIKKEFSIRKDYTAIIGIDRGSRTLVALSIVDGKGKILKQLYFGRDIWDRQRDISLRRSKLFSFADKGDTKARRKLRTLYRKESQFVKTRCYQIAHQVLDLAEQYNACIALEDLRGLKNSRLNRRGNRKVKRMPYHQFEVALRQVAGQYNTAVISVNPAYTSQICSRCGAAHKTTAVVFKCSTCGYIANRDRNASVNIAFVAGISSLCINNTPQISKRYASVNRHAWKDDGVLSCLQHDSQSPDFKPTTLVVGS